jgi:hypothetical protein
VTVNGEQRLLEVTITSRVYRGGDQCWYKASETIKQSQRFKCVSLAFCFGNAGFMPPSSGFTPSSRRLYVVVKRLYNAVMLALHHHRAGSAPPSSQHYDVFTFRLEEIFPLCWGLHLSPEGLLLRPSPVYLIG